ncbi:MAG: hypothetical protein AAB355_02635 [Patescibacteria group bacterium]
MFEKFFGEKDETEKKMSGTVEGRNEPLTDESGVVLTPREEDEEFKRRMDDPNWIREQK